MHIDQIQMATSPGRNAEQVSDSIYFEKILEKNEEVFEIINPQQDFGEKFQELLDEQEEMVKEELDEFVDSASSMVSNIIFPTDDLHIGWSGPKSDIGEAAKYTGDATESPVLCLSLTPTSQRKLGRFISKGTDNFRVVILSSSIEDCQAFHEFFNNELEELGKYIGDFAELKEFNSSEAIVDNYFDSKIEKSPNLADWDQDEESEPLEQEVHNQVQEITSISKSNIRIQTDVGDNPDFDVVALPIGELGSKYAIEVKDYVQEHNPEAEDDIADSKGSGELRSELIRKPKEYSEQADLNLITVVKGLSDEQFDDLYRLAESSGIHLLDADDYFEELKNLIISHSMEDLTKV